MLSNLSFLTFLFHCRLPEKMPPEESQLNFDQTTLAPRMCNQHSSTDKPEPTLLLCHSCEFKTNGSLRSHLEHHIKKFSQQCHLCTYSARKKEELVYHLKNHHSTRPLVSESQKDEQVMKCQIK